MPIHWGTPDLTSWGKIKSLASTLAIPAGVALAPVVAKTLGFEIDTATTEGIVSSGLLAMAAGTAYTAAAIQQNIKASELVDQRKAEESEANRLANHDIAKAIGKTIATIIALHVGTQPNDSLWRALADDHEAIWVSIAESAPLDQLGMLHDATILDAIKNNPDKPAFSLPSDKPFWQSILALMATQANADPHRLAAAPEYDAVINALDARFCYEFYQVLKQDATDGGRAYPGIMLRGMGRALVYLERIDKRQAEHGKRLDNITQLLHDVIDKLSSTAKASPTANYKVFRAWLKAANYNTEALNTNTTATERNTAAIEKNTAALANTASTFPTDNLSAANVPNNFAKFKGRLNDLAELHRRVNADPAGLPIPIIAVPGLGKTAFVTRYVYLYLADFDHVWWLRASNPKNATAASAEERSLAELLDLLGGDAKAVQAEDGQSRLDLLAKQVRTKLSRPKDGGSPRRHLLILDNVDQYATIQRMQLAGPSRVIFTARAAGLARDGAMPLRFDALSPQDGVLLLTARIKQWNPAPHTALLTAIGELVGWNALALTYLAAILARRKTDLADPAKQVLEPLRSALAAALHTGTTAPMHAKTDKELPTDYDKSIEQAFAFFIEPFAGKAEMAILDAAAWCDADNIPLTLLRDASGLTTEAFDAAVDALIDEGVLDLDGNAVNIHRLTQMSVRGHIASRGPKAKSAALTRLLDTLIALFRWPGRQAEELVDHTKTPARLAAVAHADAVIVHADTLMRKAGEGAAAPRPRAPTPAMPSQTARLRAELAHRLQDAGQLADAARHIDAAIAWGEAQSPRDERSLAIRYASRALIRQDRGDLAGAEADLKKSIDWGEAQSPRDERGLAIWYASRASIRRDRGDLAGAEADIKKSIDWYEAQSPRDERSLAVYYASRASIRKDRGDLAGAEADIKKSIDWEEAQALPNQRELAIRYASRASIRQARGDLAGAEADLKKSIDWGEAQSPRDERGLAIWYASRASIRRDRGDLAGAEADIKKSIDWGEAQSPRDERGLAIRYASRARIRQSRGGGGDLAGAEADIKKSIDWYEAQSPRDERTRAFQYETKALIFAKAGKFPEARAAIDESVRLHTAVFGADHEWTQITIRRQQAIHAGKYPG